MRLKLLPTPVPWLVLLLVLGLSAGGCTDSEPATATLRSEERPATTEDEPSADPVADEEYCAVAQQIAESPPLDEDDPTAALAMLESLADVAPAELEDDFEVLGRVIEQMSSLDPNDPGSIEEMMGIAFDPEILAASEAITAYTEEACGLDLDEGAIDDEPIVPTPPTVPSEDPSTTTEPADPTEITLDDVDAVKASAIGLAWPELLTGTMISMGVDVQLTTGTDVTIPPDQALIACTAVSERLRAKNPAVTVQVLNGTTVVAATTPEGPCAIA